jgi:hypothetical protein
MRTTVSSPDEKVKSGPRIPTGISASIGRSHTQHVVEVNVVDVVVELNVVDVNVDVEDVNVDVNVAVVYFQTSTSGTVDSTHSTISLGSPISSSSSSIKVWNCEVLSYKCSNASSVSSVSVPSTVTV